MEVVRLFMTYPWNSQHHFHLKLSVESSHRASPDLRGETYIGMPFLETRDHSNFPGSRELLGVSGEGRASRNSLHVILVSSFFFLLTQLSFFQQILLHRHSLRDGSRSEVQAECKNDLPQKPCEGPPWGLKSCAFQYCFLLKLDPLTP